MTLRARESTAHLQRLWKLTHGQDLIEYALLLALISTTVLMTVTQLGVKVPGMYATTADALPGDAGPGGQEPTDDPGNGNPGRGGNPGTGNPGNDKPVGNPGPGNPGGRGR